MQLNLLKQKDDLQSVKKSTYNIFVIDLVKSVSLFFIILTVVIVVLKIFHIAPYLVESIDVIILILISTDFIIFKKQLSDSGLNNEKIWLLFLVVLLLLNFTWDLAQNNNFGFEIYKFNIELNYIVLTIGLLSLKSVRTKLAGVSFYIERYNDSKDGKFKNSKWIYWLILLFIIVLSLFMRIQNLPSLVGVSEDEFWHFSSATEILNTGHSTYIRATLLSEIIAVFFKFFGISVAVARIPGIIFGVLTTVSIYILGKKINRSIGLIAAYLWAMSPVAILISQYTREYSLYVFLLTVFILSLFWSLGNLHKIRFNFISFLKIVIFFIPFIYYFFDRVSTFQLVLLIYLLVAFVIMFFRYKKDISRLIKKSKLLNIFILILLALLIYLVVPNSVANFFRFFSDNHEYWDFFFNPHYDFHWFRGINFDFIIVIFFLLPILFFRRNKVYLTLIIVFSIVLMYFLFFFIKGFTPRFAFYLVPFYIIFISTSIFFLYFFKNLFKKKVFASIIIIVSLIFIFNPLNSFKITKNNTLSAKNQTLWIEYRTSEKIIEAVNFVKNYKSKDEFTLITDNPSLYFYYYASPTTNTSLKKFNVMYRYSLPSNWYDDVISLIKNENVIYVNPGEKILSSKNLNFTLIYDNEAFKIYKIGIK